jgi:hypothetical protein
MSRDLILPQAGLEMPEGGTRLPQTGIEFPEGGIRLPQAGFEWPETIPAHQTIPVFRHLNEPPVFERFFTPTA